MSINPNQGPQTSAGNPVNQGEGLSGVRRTIDPKSLANSGVGSVEWSSSGDNNTLLVRLSSGNKKSEFQIHLTDEFRNEYLIPSESSDSRESIVNTLVQRAARTYLEQKNTLPRVAANAVTFKMTDRSFIVRTEKSGFINFIKRIFGMSGGYEVKETKIFVLDKENIKALQSENRDEVLESLLEESSQNLGNLVSDLSKLPSKDIVRVGQTLWELAAEKRNESAKTALLMLSQRQPAETAKALDSWVSTKNSFGDYSRATELIASFATTTPDMSGTIIETLSNIAKNAPNRGEAIKSLLELTLQPKNKELAQQTLNQLVEGNADAVGALYRALLGNQANRDELTPTVKNILVGIYNTLAGDQWRGPSGNDKSALEEIRQLANSITFTLRNPAGNKPQPAIAQSSQQAASSEPTSTRQNLSKYDLALFSYQGYLNQIPVIYEEAQHNANFTPGDTIEYFRTKIFDENKPNPHAYELFIKHLSDIATKYPEAREAVIEQLNALIREENPTIMQSDGSSVPMSDSDKSKIVQEIQEKLRAINP